MRRHYLHGPSFQGEGFAPSRPLASSDRRTADGHIGSVLCVSGFSGLEKLPSSRPGFLQQSAAHAGSSRLLQPGPGFGAAQHSACRRQFSPQAQPGSKYWSIRKKKAERLSPGNHGLTAAKSLLYILQGRLTEAEQLLRPYVESPGRFDDRMFAWTTIYNNMLYSWSTAIAAQSPGRALSMAMTAQRLMSAQTDRWLYYGALDPEVRKNTTRASMSSRCSS